ncbi:cation-translocating P-type ATPase [Desulfothermobacter acidiphilus]|uniref:cation-translocating P-type ATPase n=1 Tax=Desulfothermobacter acidiphilus TaxID=1938353 RepID=UPI003F8A6AC6
MTNWHSLSAEQALSELASDPITGLTTAEAHLRWQRHGPNLLREKGAKSPGRILWEQFTGAMVLVLLAAAVISLLLGEYRDAVAIIVIVILNALLGFVQEFRAEKALRALQKLAISRVKVKRNGEVQEIPASALVPGDLFYLEAGNLVPADGRLLTSANLRVLESLLTGEASPVDKNAEVVLPEATALGDRRNMVYKGTTVVYGRGMAVAVATGMDTELGQIAAMMQMVEPAPTPLQRRMAALGRTLGLMALLIVGAVTLLGLWHGEDIKTMFLTGVSLAVAAIPEGLPAVVTIALALGAQRMLRRRALVRRLSAVEALGSVTKICTDKTGTLTQNRMRVAALALPQPGGGFQLATPGVAATSCPETALLLVAGALCNDAVLRRENEKWSYVGDPTEGALLVAAADSGYKAPELERACPRVAELPFSSERQRMSTLHRLEGELGCPIPKLGEETPAYLLFCKGALDRLLPLSRGVWVGGEVQPLGEWQEKLERLQAELSQEGLRVLALAFRHWSSAPGVLDEEGERELLLLGLVSFKDPLRPEALAAVATCRQAGIDPVMITGDHPATALAVARELGMETQRVLTGKDLDSLNPEDLAAVAEGVTVFARVAPAHKLKIVEALQRNGHIVAMTGDGVNDAPALKKADIGVAMGRSGTDVAKEAADMVLLDDNFATIVAAVEEGRVIYDNIKKFLQYLMTTNFSEILIILVGLLGGMPVPLTPLQILWVNLVTDGLPALALSVEPAEAGVMHRPPVDPRSGIFTRRLAGHILWAGVFMAFVCLAVGYWLWRVQAASWQTVLFSTLVFSQLAHVLAIRTGTASLFAAGCCSNPAVLGAVLLTVVLQLLVVYLPPLQGVFCTVSLSRTELLLVFILGSLIFWAVEVEKWLYRRLTTG